MTRKEWLKSVGLSAVAMAAGPFQLFRGERIYPSSVRSRAAGASERVLRIAHLTDSHLEKEGSQNWMRTCIRHAQGLSDPPEVFFMGGDIINDALGRDADEIEAQWAQWRSVRQEMTLPAVYCIGNHDVWGKSEHRADPRWGKAWAMEEFGLERPYYDFARAGWHFVVLDSTHTNEDGSWYTGRLDDAQFEWLEATLGRIDPATPVFVLSHIPILCAAAFFDGDNEKTGNWRIPGAWVHIDARRIVELFHRHPNVRVAISGHIHLLDAVLYNDVTYYCNGAVCGAWWGGDYHQTHPGYAIINLYADGSFDREYAAYGWEE